MDPKIAKKTRDTLGKVISKPPLTEKLLGKPPFRFLHDITTSVIKTTGFMNGLFTDFELNSENVKEKDNKIAFLQKVIDMVCLVTGKSLSVRPQKVVAGHEPDKTNELLQVLAEAIKMKVDNEEYVRKLLKGGEPNVKENDSRSNNEDGQKHDSDDKKTRDKDRSRDKSKDREKSSKSRSREEKSKDKEEKKERGKDKDREKSRDREKDSDKEKEHRRKRNLRATECAPEATASVVDSGLLAYVEEPKKKGVKKYSLLEPQGDKLVDEEVKTERLFSQDVRPKKGSPSKQLGGPKVGSMSKTHMKMGSTKPGRRASDMKTSDVGSKTSKGRRQSSQGKSDPKIKSVPVNTDNAGKENESPSGEKAVNSDGNANTDAPVRLQRPTSAKGSRRRREEDDEFLQKREPAVTEDDLPPQVASSRRMDRPSSARPAAPRPRQEGVESEPAMRLGNGRPANVIGDNDQSDDDENFLVEESAPPMKTEPDQLPTSKPEGDDGAEHGALVKKMLESKKEFEEESQQPGPQKKTTIERPAMSDAARMKQRAVVQREIDKLRNSIQSLTRSANPLGKIMDYVQEDLDSMQKELEKWKAENKEHALALKRERGITDRSIEPLKSQLSEIDQAIKDQLDRIAATKANIIRNDQKVEKMIKGITSS